MLNFMSIEGGSRIDLSRRLLFGMLAIGHPINGKMPGETVHIKVGYF